MSHYEIEIKSLLGNEEKATALIEKMRTKDTNLSIIGKSSQLNHYFTDGDIHKLYTSVENFFTGDQHEKFKMITEKGNDFSVRTRQKDDEVLLVVKAALDGGTSSNSVSRLEFEEPVSVTLAELDALVEAAGYVYQAKWSRNRVEYAYKDITVCLDKNAGYGYLAEFEKVTDDEASLTEIKVRLEDIMAELEVEELSQERLARMFAYYNANWSDYYGTEKTFNIQ